METKLITEYQIYPFYCLLGGKAKDPIHTYMIGKQDGLVECHEFETLYRPLEKVFDYGEFLGFVCDDGSSGFIETRIPVDVLKELLGKKSTTSNTSHPVITPLQSAREAVIQAAKAIYECSGPEEYQELACAVENLEKLEGGK